MSERRDFPKWKVELAYIAQDGVCARCGRPLDRGFHRHHKDGNPMNNSLENLELLCPECHYATFGHEGEKNPLEEHRNLERKILERLDDLIGKALDGQVSGAVMAFNSLFEILHNFYKLHLIHHSLTFQFSF